MDIDKAIKVLEAENKSPWNQANSDLRNSAKLGIEALKKLKELRAGKGVIFDKLLPGETTY